VEASITINQRKKKKRGLGQLNYFYAKH